MTTAVSVGTVGSDWPRWDALGLFAAGVIGILVWLWLARRVAAEEQAKPAASGWIGRRRQVSRACLYVGLVASLSIIFGESYDSSAWRDFANGDLAVDSIEVIEEIGEVTTITHKRGNDTYKFSTTVRYGVGNRNVVTQEIETEMHPREAGYRWLHAIYNPEDVERGVYITDDPEDVSLLQGSPARWELFVFLAGIFVLVWGFSLWDERGYVAPACGKESLSRRAIKWKLNTTLLLISGALVVLFPIVVEHDRGFDNDVSGEMTGMFIVLGFVSLLFLIPAGVRLHRWALDVVDSDIPVSSFEVGDAIKKRGKPPGSRRSSRSWAASGSYSHGALGASDYVEDESLRWRLEREKRELREEFELSRKSSRYAADMGALEVGVWIVLIIAGLFVGIALQNEILGSVGSAFCTADQCPDIGLVFAGWLVAGAPLIAAFGLSRWGDSQPASRPALVSLAVWVFGLTLVFPTGGTDSELAAKSMLGAFGMGGMFTALASLLVLPLVRNLLGRDGRKYKRLQVASIIAAAQAVALIVVIVMIAE